MARPSSALVALGAFVAGLGASGALTQGPATGVTVEWSTAKPATSPPPLAYAAAAYDGDDGTVVLFGGRTVGQPGSTGGSLSNDTWVWNGSTWTEYPPSPDAPPAREMASMAFDPALHNLILFGGRGANGQFLDDTWAWNGVSWTQETSTPAPLARAGASLAYDSAGHLVLFGGEASSAAGTPGAVLADTWTWTSSGWVRSSSSGPSGRWGAAMSYDASSHTTVLFSGDTQPMGASTPNTPDDTWLWDGTSWSAQSPAISPPPRYGATLVGVAAARGAVLFDGSGTNGELTDTWVWSGGNWSQISTTGAQPLAGRATAFDAKSSALVAFGGAAADGTLQHQTAIATVGPAAPPTTPTTTTPATTVAPTTTSSDAGTAPPSTTAATQPAKHTGGHPRTSTTLPPAAPKGGQHGPAPPLRLGLEASAYRVPVGGAVELAGAGFSPGAAVTITFHSQAVILGRTVADRSGQFRARVDVPTGAAPGDHELVATGMSPSGGQTIVVTRVYVTPGANHSSSSVMVKATMIALAIAIPGGTWLAMAAFSRRRRLGS